MLRRFGFNKFSILKLTLIFKSRLEKIQFSAIFIFARIFAIPIFAPSFFSEILIDTI